MYGYAAKYAPSSVIEARIDALVVCLSTYFTIFHFYLWYNLPLTVLLRLSQYVLNLCLSFIIVCHFCVLQGTNMLSRLLHVRQQTAKQAVITAIDLLG